MKTREQFVGVNSIKFNRHFQSEDEFYVGGEEEERLQGYLDEYHFRFNRRNNMKTIFDLLMRRMVYYEPKRLNKRIKVTAT
jgi:hypothetical protein